MITRSVPELRKDFADSGEMDFYEWLSRQPEGDPYGGVPQKPPSIVKQVASLGRAISDHAKHGFASCSEEDLKARNRECEECSLLLPSGRCSVCGCFMKIKATWQEQRCPKGKW